MAAELNGKITATRVISVENKDALLRDNEQTVIYRCDDCKALVLEADGIEHLKWHSRILYVPK